MPVQQQGLFREFVTYVIWLFLAGITSMFIIFLIASIVFQTKTVPPEASLLFFGSLWIVTYLKLREKRKTFIDIGLEKTGLAKYFFVGTLFGTACMFFIYVILLLLKTVESKPEILSGSIVLGALTGFGYTLIQSGTEELVFRGYLLNLFSRKSRAFSIFLTSALFSVAHFWQGINPVGWLNIFLFGVFAAQLFYAFHSLWVPIGFHVAWNYLQNYVFGFPIYGRENSGIFQLSLISDNLISGGTYGPEGSLITSALLLLLILLTYRLRKEHLLTDKQVLDALEKH